MVYAWAEWMDHIQYVRVGKDGRVLKTQRSHARGWSEDPATWEDLKGKFEECAQGILPQAQQNESLAMIRELDKLPKVKELMRALQV